MKLPRVSHIAKENINAEALMGDFIHKAILELKNKGGFCFLCGYTRILLHDLTPYSDKRTELHMDILPVSQKCWQRSHLATNDVITEFTYRQRMAVRITLL